MSIKGLLLLLLLAISTVNLPANISINPATNIKINLPTATEQIESVYTDLSIIRCKTLEFTDGNPNAIQRCPGVGGYHLLVYHNDNHLTITIVAPNAKQFPLNMSQVSNSLHVSNHYCSFGNKAEWRVIKQQDKVVPIALIVPYNINEDPETPKKLTSYLMVTKITPESACITAKIKSEGKNSDTARTAADTAGDKPCLQ